MNKFRIHQPSSLRSARGFSLVELMVALVLGLVMMGAFGVLYFSGNTATRRLEHLSTMQQSVRTAFEYFANDVHDVGTTGCQHGRSAGLPVYTSTDLANNWALGIEGYNAAATPTYPLATTTNSSAWQNSPNGTLATFTPSIIGAAGLTQGSDILFLRITGSRPLRLTADTSGNQVSIENASLGGVCADYSQRVGGFCPGHWALIASCTNAERFRVQTLVNNGTSVTLNSTGALTTAYTTATTEVFPLQTVMYYVRPGSRAGTMSLYRRIFDGDDGTPPNNVGDEQELIEDVENLQVTYGYDSTATPDRMVDDYRTANDVAEWSRVVSVRMSVLLRGREPIRATEASVAASGSVNGVVVTYPTTGDPYDRRVFTTTVALRNRIANY